jgi:glycerol-3-phosphate dehydrogenase
MKEAVQADIAIIGGGIAGLWLLNRLRQSGFSVILLESNSIGGGQTHKAQGIIHGGMKYALQGKTTSATQAIADMPAKWEECLQGTGEIDLSRVPVLSKQQYLWSTGSLTSKLAGFFAGLALKSNTRLLDKKDFPEIFQHPQFQGQVYTLDETIIDMPMLLRELMIPHQDVIFKIDPMDEKQLELDENDRLISFNIQATPLQALRVNAQKFIFTAGSGNELLLKKLKRHKVYAQRRALHMVIVKHDYTHALYAHCLGLGATPRITITTHRARDGKTIWYLGGQIAEEGVKLSADEQIRIAKNELKELFPWLDFSNAEFASFYVDRAENMQPNAARPDSCYVQEIENILIAWPTKLAFAPLLAAEILQLLTKANIKPCVADLRELRAWPIPALAKPIWDQLLP